MGVRRADWKKGLMMGNSREDWAEKLKAYRQVKRLSQEKLAQLVGTTVTTISRVERGKVYPSPMLREALRRAGVGQEETADSGERS